MIKKYLKKDIYLQKKDKKLLMNWELNSIIIEYQKITKVSKNIETVTNENDKETPEERCKSPEERQKIDNLRLIIIV